MGVLGGLGILGVLSSSWSRGSWVVWGSQGDSGGWVPLTTHLHSLADHDPDVVLPVLVGLVAAGTLLVGAVTYSIYYRKRKIRQYRLRQRQRQLEMKPMRSRQEDAPLHDLGAPP